MRGKKWKQLFCGLAASAFVMTGVPDAGVLNTNTLITAEAASKVSLNKTSLTLNTGSSYKLTLKGVKKGTKVTWKASSKNVTLTVDKKDSRNCTVKAAKAGTIKVTAKAGGKTYTCTVKVPTIKLSASSGTLNKGKYVDITLQGTSSAAKWSTSNKKVATLKKVKGNTYRINAVGTGSATITAKLGSKKYTYKLKVIAPPSMSQSSVNINYGASYTLQLKNALGKTEWSIKNGGSSIINMKSNGAKATISVKLAGKSTYVYAKNGGKTYQCKITTKAISSPKLNSTSLSLTAGSSYQLKVSGKKSTTATTYTSSNTGIATVDKNGKVTAKKVGTCNITAFVDGLILTCKVNVKNVPATEPSTEPSVPETEPTVPETEPSVPETDVPTPSTDPAETEEETEAPVHVNSVSLNCNTLEFSGIGEVKELSVTVSPSNADNKSVSWSSSNTSVATVDSTGKVTSVGAGSATITVKTADGGYTDTCSVTVTVPNSYEVESILDDLTTYTGGRGFSINVYTKSAIDNINIVLSNNNIQYNTVFVKSEGSGFCYGFYARKAGTCVVSVYCEGTLRAQWNVTITSTDANWAEYETWKANVKSAMGEKWSNATSFDKVVNFGQYLLDNYDYISDPNASFHKNGGGNCNASAYVLCDIARELGFQADVVTPPYAGSNISHVAARVVTSGGSYFVDAGTSGTAPRGSIICIKE